MVFFTLGPTVLATRLKDDSTRLDIFNRASYPVIICFSFNPPCPTPCGKDMSRIRYSSVPYPGFNHAPVQPLPSPPPFFEPEPPNPQPFRFLSYMTNRSHLFSFEFLPLFYLHQLYMPINTATLLNLTVSFFFFSIVTYSNCDLVYSIPHSFPFHSTRPNPTVIT